MHPEINRGQQGRSGYLRVLIVEDDEKLCKMLQLKFQENRMECDLCLDGKDAMEYIKRDAYDVIALDRMLPHKDGLTILKEIRANHMDTPVIMVTALGQLDHRVEGLDCGADDYLAKPFEIAEFFARVRALARRKSKALESDQIEYGDFVYDIDQMKLRSQKDTEKDCHLSKRESELLLFLIHNEGRVLSRELILDRIWGIDSDVMDSNLDNFICFLRKRLKSIGSGCQIKTVRGVGYRLES